MFLNILNIFTGKIKIYINILMIEMYDIEIKKRISKQNLGYIMMNPLGKGNGNMSLRERKNKILNLKWKA